MCKTSTAGWHALLVGIALVVIAAGRGEETYSACAAEADVWSAREYELAGLAAIGKADSLVELITAVVEPSSWRQVGGRGIILAVPPDAPKLLAIEQSNKAHKQIVEVLARLQRAICEPVAGSAEGQTGLSSAEAKLLKALASSTQMEFIETRLSEVLKYLQDFHKIRIRMDRIVVDKANVGEDTPVTTNLRRISLQSALRLMLADLPLMLPGKELICIVESDGLTITTKEAAAERLLIKLYKVDDLVEMKEDGAGKQWQCDGLVRAITSVVSPGSWHAVGGTGTIAAISTGPACSLVVCQTQTVHDEIADVLCRLRRLSTGHAIASASEQAIHEALDSPTQGEFIETPLLDVVDYLKDLHSIEIQVNKRSLDAAGVETVPPVTATLKGTRLRHALRLVLRQTGLTYEVRDEVLLITSEKEAEQSVVRIYPVPDLLPAAATAAQSSLHAAQLARVIASSVAPKSWQAGGSGGIAPYLSGRIKCLLVRQSKNVHEQILSLLTALGRVGRGEKEGGVQTTDGETPESLPPRGKLRAALDASTSLEFRETPLEAVIDNLNQQHKTEIQLDWRAIDKSKIRIGDPVSMRLGGVRLRSGLRLVLREWGLTYVLEGDCLVITTLQAAASRPEVRVYPLTNLLRVDDVPTRGRAFAEQVAKAITTTIAPKSWNPHGEGTIMPCVYQRIPCLLVNQTQSVHEEVGDLLAALHQQTTADGGPRGKGVKAAESERRIADALKSPTQAEFVAAPLSHVIEYFADKHHIPIYVDRSVLHGARIQPDQPVTVKQNASLHSVLSEILGKAGLSYIARDDVVLVTTREQAENWLHAVVYRLEQPDEGLVEKITSTIEANGGRAARGRAAVVAISEGKSRFLVVTQNSDVHRRISELLGSPGMRVEDVMPRAPPGPGYDGPRSVPERRRPKDSDPFQ